MGHVEELVIRLAALEIEMNCYWRPFQEKINK